MSEVSKLLTSLSALRESLVEPVSHMELIRRALAGEVSRMHMPHFPIPLHGAQRQFMTENIDRLQSFLETQDGADAMELFLATFEQHCYSAE